MKKTYQLIITLSLAVIAICLGYTTCQSYVATHETLKFEDEEKQSINIENRLSSEQLEILELRIKIYELQKKLEQYENGEQIINEKQE